VLAGRIAPTRRCWGVGDVSAQTAIAFLRQSVPVSMKAIQKGLPSARPEIRGVRW